MRHSTATVVFALVAACAGPGEGELPPGETPDTAVAAVEAVMGHLVSGDFAAAAHLTLPDQAALLSLSEGATVSQVAKALQTDDVEVTANFWSGFAQGVGDLLDQELTFHDRGTVTQDGFEFHLVEVIPASGQGRVVVTRPADGHRVDLFASFGVGLAERLRSPLEILVESQSPDAVAVLRSFRDTVPSLLVAASDESISAEAVQNLLHVVELITRVG